MTENGDILYLFRIQRPRYRADPELVVGPFSETQPNPSRTDFTYLNLY